MNIFIIAMDEPVQTNAFIEKIIENRKKDIVGLAVTKGDRLTIQKNKSKLAYVFSLFLIMGFYYFIKNSVISIIHKIKKRLNSFLPSVINNPTILRIAQKYGIKTWQINTPNDKKFLEELKKLKIDVIINQSQSILKDELLSIPKIGVINRHNALLPRNRGRLTPFWVLYKNEEETGVSIHFVTKELDAGKIIVQKKFPVAHFDNFNTIVTKNYELAPLAMLEALEILENGENNFIKNDPSMATYNSTPTLKEAWDYRKKRLLRFFN